MQFKLLVRTVKHFSPASLGPTTAIYLSTKMAATVNLHYDDDDDDSDDDDDDDGEDLDYDYMRMILVMMLMIAKPLKFEEQKATIPYQ